MVTLDFVLTPENCVQLHDALTCLAKFSDSVSVEARERQLAFTALNSSKSGYASLVFDANVFFRRYDYTPDVPQQDAPFTFSILNKALASTFKGRLADSRGRDTAVEKCEVSIQDRPDRAECRFIVKLFCKHGVTKTYKLTYEPVEILHALFDKRRAQNHWKIQARQLRDIIEYFGAKTDQLDIYSQDGRVTLTSYTEKIANGREILKQPLQTSVSIDVLDFEDFKAAEKIHTTISIKDFKNVVYHAENMKASITARYSQPSRPLQLSYGVGGLNCEFTLMTIGDAPNPSPSIKVPTQDQIRHKISTRSMQRESENMTAMPPPSYATSNGALGKSQRPSISANLDSASLERNKSYQDSLFVPEEDDRQWDPANYDGDDNGILGWDASADNDSTFKSILHDSFPASRVERDSLRGSGDFGLAPTQRASEVRGLFD